MGFFCVWDWIAATIPSKLSSSASPCSAPCTAFFIGRFVSGMWKESDDGVVE